jgi:hypothetical protein
MKILIIYAGLTKIGLGRGRVGELTKDERDENDARDGGSR